MIISKKMSAAPMREVVLTRLFAGLLFIVATYTMISTLIEMLA